MNLHAARNSIDADGNDGLVTNRKHLLSAPRSPILGLAVLSSAKINHSSLCAIACPLGITLERRAWRPCVADSPVLRNIQYAAYPNVNEACKSGEQFGVQAVGGLAIIAWTCVTAGATFVLVNLAVGMRVSSDVEEAGLDVSEHGAVGDAWAPGAPLKGDTQPAGNGTQAGMVYLGGGQYGQA